MAVRQVELMAPAGNWESLQAAINAKADSVYFGIDQLNMRARASINFSVGDLKEIGDICGINIRCPQIRTNNSYAYTYIIIN